jgi:hypothetical protein
MTTKRYALSLCMIFFGLSSLLTLKASYPDLTPDFVEAYEKTTHYKKTRFVFKEGLTLEEAKRSTVIFGESTPFVFQDQAFNVRHFALCSSQEDDNNMNLSSFMKAKHLESIAGVGSELGDWTYELYKFQEGSHDLLDYAITVVIKKLDELG